MSNINLQSEDGLVWRIEVDGADMADAVRQFSFEGVAGQYPQLNLTLGAYHVTHVSGEARIHITEKTKSALTALGWTPPEE